ncbi:MAG: ABC transporter ATP-binding protein [Nitriliruptorales bacterium]
MTAPILTLEEVTLRFGSVTALEGLSFSVGHHELVALIGPNGAGKTSVFNCIDGVYRPDHGRIRVDGVELVGGPGQAAVRGVGRTFQNLGLFRGLTVLDNLMLGRHLLMKTGFFAGAAWIGRARREEAAHRARVWDIVELLHLTPFVHWLVSELSFGWRKRVELGRALVMEPRLLLLDEPVGGLAPPDRHEVARYIREARERRDLAVVVVEHDMGFVMDLAERVIVLDAGRCIAAGSPVQVRTDPTVVDAYLGPG